MLQHKGYLGTVEFSEEDDVFHGRVSGINDVVTFEGASVSEIHAEFRKSVDDYLQYCAEIGKRPDKGQITCPPKSLYAAGTHKLLFNNTRIFVRASKNSTTSSVRLHRIRPIDGYSLPLNSRKLNVDRPARRHAVPLQ